MCAQEADEEPVFLLSSDSDETESEEFETEPEQV